MALIKQIKDKGQLREVIWRTMSELRGKFGYIPATGRLPEFFGMEFAMNRMTALDEFGQADVVKVDMSERDAGVRKVVVDLGKTLAVTATDLARSFVRVLKKEDIPFHYTVEDSIGRRTFNEVAREVSVDEKVSIDIAIIPSLLVDPSNGRRIHLGGGAEGRMTADLEFAILKDLGYISDRTMIVTLVHPLQLINLEESQMSWYDVPADVVVTSERCYRAAADRSRMNLDWGCLNENHFVEIFCLKWIKEKELQLDQC